MSNFNTKDHALLYAYEDISSVLLALESDLNPVQLSFAIDTFAMEDTLASIREVYKGVIPFTSHERDRLEPYAGGNWPKETAEETMAKILKENV